MSEPIEVVPGRAEPLGAAWDGRGTSFSLFSDAAEAVELCLFDAQGAETRAPLQRSGDRWHGYVPGAGPGQRYGYRVHGPYDPDRGLRFNPAKLLLDPYALAIDGDVHWDASQYGHAGEDDGIDHADSAPAMPRCVVVDGRFDWEDDRPPAVPWAQTVIYETHVKGFTRRMPGVPEALCGTYAGLAGDAAISHLTSMGITAVELLPVHHHVDEDFLHPHGLSNYWGYSTIGFFAPHAAYAAGEPVAEFKAMVKALHRAGIEVILDVVYNHTGEGTHLGRTLSWRGIDNAAYYRLRPDDPRRNVDVTGTGNTLRAAHPAALRMIVDSLRYWAQECRVDGFRFDLASTLARADDGEFARDAAFFSAIAADPVLSGVKLIAEPWDIGPGGYQLGSFPAGWSEWNDRYRDTVRDWWRGGASRRDLATRLAGSDDAFRDRGPCASINYVTCHDGFTLRDLVSYDAKHNEANMEGNRDGRDDNKSCNHGVEGPSDDPAISALRARQQRNLLATVMVSRGVPMLLGGDELNRTQHGNNNAWCQDSELSWLEWEHADPRLLGFARELIAMRRAHPALRPERYADPRWFDASGAELREDGWNDHAARDLVMLLDGEDPILVVFNAAHWPVTFQLAPILPGREWSIELSTDGPRLAGAAGALELPDRALAVLR